MNENFDILRKFTSTSLFIAPLLGKKIVPLDEFVNAYIKDEVRGIDYNRGIYVLFKVSEKDKFEHFLESERTRGAKIIEEYDYPNNHIMVVYQYDKRFERDVELILSGKFSKTSSFYQSNISETFKATKLGVTKNIITFQHSIFKKLPEYVEYWQELYGLELTRNDEVWHHYKEREVFDQLKFNKL